MNLYCTHPDCGKPVENRDLGLCASHAREQRKLEEQSKRQKVVVTELKKVSPKMAAALVEYSKKKAVWIKGKKCVVYKDKDAVEVHHAKGKSSIELLLDETYWRPVSRDGHIYIHDHQTEAIEKGWSVSRLAKTEPSKI